MDSTTCNATSLSASSLMVQRACPAGGGEHVRAISRASCAPSSLRYGRALLVQRRVAPLGGELLPQRGSVIPAGSRVSRPVTTASGSIDSAREGIGEGDSEVGTAAGGLLAAGWTLAVPIIKRWFAENYRQEKWAAEARNG